MTNQNYSPNVPNWILNRQFESALLNHANRLQNIFKSTINKTKSLQSIPFHTKEAARQELEEIEDLSGTSHWEWDSRENRASLSTRTCQMIKKPKSWQPGILAFLRVIRKEDRLKVLYAFRMSIENKKSEIACDCEIEIEGRILDLSLRGRVKYEGSDYRILVVVQDVTQVKDYERLLRDLTFVDSLTGLANRALFRDQLRQTIQNSGKNPISGAVLMIDIDDFRRINDTMGHTTGDRLLQEVGCRLMDTVRSNDLVARMGGDEFAIILSELADEQDVSIVARKILSAFEEPVTIETRKIFVGMSIGIALFPIDGTEVSDIVSSSDMAMSQARKSGSNSFKFYSNHLKIKSLERLSLENLLRGAVERDEIQLFIQPQIDMDTGGWIGGEALIRWASPELGLVSPVEFIGIAEENGMIIKIGRWVFRKACEQAVQWNRTSERPIKIAVNLSPYQIRHDAGCIDFFRSTVKETGVNPSWIDIEITEGGLFENFDEANKFLHSLSSMGFSILLDDFGTGYSALSRLKQIPVSGIKIDRSFLQGVPGCISANDILRSIVSLANILHLNIVVEGIESKEQAEFAHSIGCKIAQGFYWSIPVPSEKFFADLNQYQYFGSSCANMPGASSPVRSPCLYNRENVCYMRRDDEKCSLGEKR